MLPMLAGCAAGPKLTVEPVKWFESDDKPIPMPRVVKEYQIWEIMDHILGETHV